MALDDYVRVIEAASELRVTPRQVRQLIGAGRLFAEQLSPRLYLVERRSVEEYKLNRRASGRPLGATKGKKRPPQKTGMDDGG
jgi:hypothetical protein